MSSTILVITNLSNASHNALNYTCQAIGNGPFRIVLLRVFSLLTGFAGDGVAMAAAADALEKDQAMLEGEKSRMLEAYPGIQLETRLVTGPFEEVLLDEVRAERAVAVVLGEEGDHRQLLSWDSYVLDAFIDLPVPVLLIPAGATFRGIRNMAFACNYRRLNLQGPVNTLKRLLSYLQCRLHFVHVTKEHAGLSEEEQAWKEKWRQEMTGLPVLFDELEGRDVVATLDAFCESRQIDVLAIRPHRAGIWASIFDKSQTKEIMHLNKVPILALRSMP